MGLSHLAWGPVVRALVLAKLAIGGSGSQFHASSAHELDGKFPTILFSLKEQQQGIRQSGNWGWKISHDPNRISWHLGAIAKSHPTPNHLAADQYVVTILEFDVRHRRESLPVCEASNARFHAAVPVLKKEFHGDCGEGGAEGWGLPSAPGRNATDRGMPQRRQIP